MAYRLLKTCTYEEEIRKSRFVAIAQAVQNEQQCKDFLADYSQPKATHNCWAWRMGENYRFNDDGEPGGTAGRPILQAIESQGLDQVIVLVIRWFGGIKLGTGGLARAYGGVANNCLRLAERAEIVAVVLQAAFCPYPLIDLISSRLKELRVEINQAKFNVNGVDWILSIPESKLAMVKSMFIDLTNGQGQLQDINK